MRNEIKQQRSWFYPSVIRFPANSTYIPCIDGTVDRITDPSINLDVAAAAAFQWRNYGLTKLAKKDIPSVRLHTAHT